MMKNTTIAWAIMMIATIVSYASVESAMAARIAVSVAALVAAVKSSLIINYFMELKGGTFPCNIIFGIWTVFSFLVILGGTWYVQ
jgi:heme/copper-type cytochrome/quinol oxidase subunit 4